MNETPRERPARRRSDNVPSPWLYKQGRRDQQRVDRQYAQAGRPFARRDVPARDGRDVIDRFAR